MSACASQTRIAFFSSPACGRRGEQCKLQIAHWPLRAQWGAVFVSAFVTTTWPSATMEDMRAARTRSRWSVWLSSTHQAHACATVKTRIAAVANLLPHARIGEKICFGRQGGQGSRNHNVGREADDTDESPVSLESLFLCRFSQMRPVQLGDLAGARARASCFIQKKIQVAHAQRVVFLSRQYMS